MNKKIKNLLIISCLILVTLICMMVVLKSSNKSLDKAGGKPKMDSYVSVKTDIVKVKTLEGYVLTNGEIESENSVVIYPSMGGKIAQVNVHLGEKVKKGDVIAKIDPSEPGTRYALSPVESSIDGSVLTIPSKIGTTVTINSEITMIGDIENLQVVAQIPERYISELKNGLKAEISLQSYPDLIFEAKVVRVSPVVDKLSRTKEVILNFTNKDLRINAGMFAKVKLFTSKYSGEIVVPIDSVVTDDNNSYVYVIGENSVAEKRLVKVGKSVDDNIQILEGLYENEKIVVEGMLSVSNGAKVKEVSAE